MFSKSCEYGIRAMIHIAQQQETTGRVSLKDIAREIDSPEAFTGKILQTLTREGLLNSLKGPTGGFELAREAGKINLAEIVLAVDGDNLFNGCALGLSTCDSEKPCPAHEKFAIVRDELTLMLRTSILDEMAMGLKNGVSFLTR
jgi:Rrf2 family protein